MRRCKNPALLTAYVIILSAVALAVLSGCVVYDPVPVPAAYYTSPFDTAWNSAVRAAEDAGIQIEEMNKSTGDIFGQASGTNVNIVLSQQADGRIRIEVNFQGSNLSTRETRRISDDFYYYYDHYMGRR